MSNLCYKDMDEALTPFLKVRIMSMGIINICNKTSLQIPAMTSLLNSEKVHEDDIFVRQCILQFLSGESKDYKYLKSP